MNFKSVNGEIHADKATGTSGKTYFGMKQRVANGTFKDGDDGIQIIMPAAVTQKVKTLDEVKAEAKQHVNQQRLQMEGAGFDFNGIHIQTDEASMKRIANAAITAATAVITSSAFSVEWTAEDNSTVALDAQTMLAMQAAMTARGKHLNDTAKTLKAAIDNIDVADFDNEQKAIEAITGYLDENNSWVNGVGFWKEHFDLFNQEGI